MQKDTFAKRCICKMQNVLKTPRFERTPQRLTCSTGTFSMLVTERGKDRACAVKDEWSLKDQTAERWRRSQTGGGRSQRNREGNELKEGGRVCAGVCERVSRVWVEERRRDCEVRSQTSSGNTLTHTPHAQTRTHTHTHTQISRLLLSEHYIHTQTAPVPC